MREAEEDKDKPDPLTDLYGVILTDSMVLAAKYGVDQQTVLDVFNDFIQTAYDQQMYWYFLDASAYSDYITENGAAWQAYNDIISQFIADQQLNPGMGLSLFIVGGNDVVPVPHIADPNAHGEGDVPTDMPYSFEGDFLTGLIEGEWNNIEADMVRNTVGRLPLEEGELQSDIQADLGAYFNISAMYAGGIPVGNVVMTSNSAWIPASSTMSQHLPLLFTADDPEMVRNGMYISPKLQTDEPATVDLFAKVLAKADMLMFNLHGADQPDYNGFYNDNCAEAFNPMLLEKSNARVLNTVACFGARYTGYSRPKSMLLSALYGGGVLLYTGSLISVPMLWNNEARELLLNPGTGSEVLMRLYPLYQFKGMPAGQALLQAKLDYFNLCRHVEEDGFTLSTAMMFCLYGNPMLHVRQRCYVIESALQNDAMPPAPVKAIPQPFRKTKTQRLLDRRQTKDSLLGQIRGRIDANFEAMHSIVERNLYSQLGLEPRWLESVDEYYRPNVNGAFDMGYSYNYHNPEVPFAADTYVEIDIEGNIKKIITTK